MSLIYGFIISNDCDNSVDGGLKNSTSSSKSLLEGNYFAAVYIFIQDIVGMSQTWIPKNMVAASLRGLRRHQKHKQFILKVDSNMWSPGSEILTNWDTSCDVKNGFAKNRGMLDKVWKLRPLIDSCKHVDAATDERDTDLHFSI